MFKKRSIGYVTLGCKVRRALWNIVYMFLFRPFGTKVFRLWRLSILRAFGASVDWNAEFYASAKVWAPWQLKMAAGSCVGPNAIVYNQAMVTMERDACLSQYAYICTAGHETGKINNAKTGLVVSPVLIESNAWVGTRAFIGMGVTIGHEAVVGACACVFKDVAPNTIVGGNPATELRK